MILVDIQPSTTSIIDLLERWGVYQVPTKASAKKEKRKKEHTTKYGGRVASTRAWEK